MSAANNQPVLKEGTVPIYQLGVNFYGNLIKLNILNGIVYEKMSHDVYFTIAQHILSMKSYGY